MKKLLLDQNLSPTLINHLANDYQKIEHVYFLGLDKSLDQEIWEYAKEKNFMIVTKDADFNERSVLYGFPPKVIWIRIGNCITSRTLKILSGKKLN